MLRDHGITPLGGDLDNASSLGRLAGLWHNVLHFFVSSPSAGQRDGSTHNPIRALRKARSIP